MEVVLDDCAISANEGIQHLVGDRRRDVEAREDVEFRFLVFLQLEAKTEPGADLLAIDPYFGSQADDVPALIREQGEHLVLGILLLEELHGYRQVDIQIIHLLTGLKADADLVLGGSEVVAQGREAEAALIVDAILPDLAGAEAQVHAKLPEQLAGVFLSITVSFLS